MTDNTTTRPINSWLPLDAWAAILSLLDNDELAGFRQVCKSFNDIGSHAMILQPLYNRLRAFDKTLPADLQTAAEQAGKSPLAFFKDTFEKIQARQQQEITYLTQYHAVVMATPAHMAVLQQNTSVTLKSLAAKHTLLDAVNSVIVTARIINRRTKLDLNGAHITRLPVALFKAAGYADFWQNLTVLNCNNNQFATLNVQELPALQVLMCNNNQLTALNVKGLATLQQLQCNNNQLTALDVTGLAALQWLYCHNNQLTALNVQRLTALRILGCCSNQLTSLDVTGLAALRTLSCGDNQLAALSIQGLAALQTLECGDNPLTDLNLTGVAAAIKNQHAELERRLLFTQLSQANSTEARLAIIARLGADYTYQNYIHGYPASAEKLFIIDTERQVYNLALSALSDLSLTPTYLPSSGAGNNASNAQQEEPHDKEKKQDDNPSAGPDKEKGDEPEAKRRKNS